MRKTKKITKQMIKVGINLNKLESLSRIMINSIHNNSDLKSWDVGNLSYILADMIFETKQRFNNIERVMKI
ncbi:MAG: hypothetical protein A2Y25_03345 [Candidatus Melainabacteria bacterium GWF2_37_15]|nr:MAG: hypothetical protein A2Y25_03345 [Candidatus Melainabacteria bacterium GWF2_37_15]